MHKGLDCLFESKSRINELEHIGRWLSSSIAYRNTILTLEIGTRENRRIVAKWQRQVWSRGQNMMNRQIIMTCNCELINVCGQPFNGTVLRPKLTAFNPIVN